MHMGSSPIVRTNTKGPPDRGGLLCCYGRCAASNPCRLTRLQNLQLAQWRQRRRSVFAKQNDAVQASRPSSSVGTECRKRDKSHRNAPNRGPFCCCYGRCAAFSEEPVKAEQGSFCKLETAAFLIQAPA